MDIDRVEVAGLIGQISRDELLSRFGALSPDAVWHKAAGEIVTEADLETERRLTGALTGLLPGSVVVGEEGVAADPSRLELLAGARPVWVIDPLDGTARFARGERHFSTMVALVSRQRIIASWIYAPALDLAADAVLGQGVRLGGRPVRLPVQAGQGRRVLVTDPEFQTGEDRVQLARLAAAGYQVQPCQSVGTAYLDLLAGRFDAAVFGWTKVWDHAPGLLLHGEAGGVSAARDGQSLRLAGGSEPPLLVAANPEAMRQLRAVVLGER